MKPGKTAKTVITFGRLKKLIAESLDYHRCYLCRQSEREDNFSVPYILNSYFIPDYEMPVWRRFLNSHWEQIKALGLDSSRYNYIEPVCDRCRKKIEDSREYKELVGEWEKAKTDSLGGEDEKVKLQGVSDKIKKNIEALKEAISEMFGQMAKDFDGHFRIYRRMYGKIEEYGSIDYQSCGNLVWIKTKLDKGESFPAVLKLTRVRWNVERKTVGLGIDLMTANVEDVKKAVDDHKNDIWNWL